MAATKTTNETQDQASSPAPVVVNQPEAPEKISGPHQVAWMAESVANPPPNGASSHGSGAEMLAGGSSGLSALPEPRRAPRR